MKCAFVFNGQGSQQVGMGKDIYDTFPTAQKLFNQSGIKKLCFEGPSEALNQTHNTQVAVFTTSMAIAKVLAEKGIYPQFVAGLSLGEYTALCFSDAISFEEGLSVVKQRGQLMADELAGSESSMAAVMNIEIDLLKQIVNQVNEVALCQIANYNSPKQIVITGKNEAIELAMAKIKAHKGRVIQLKVSGAFHSSLLDQASLKLKEILSHVHFKQPKLRVVYNTTGQESDESLIDILAKQINHSVYFQQSIEYLLKQGVDCFVEIGPGKALSGFILAIDPTVKVYSAFDVDSIEQIVKEINHE